MIRIKTCLDDLSISVTGHADAGIHGQDIVCAAASFCLQQMIYSISEFNDRENCLLHEEIRLEPGDSSVHYVCKEWGRLGIRARMTYAVEGFRMLEDRYPENVVLIEEV